MARGNPSKAIPFIFITVLIDVVGWGIIIPVMPKLLETLGHQDLSHSAQDGGWLAVTYAIMQFIFAPILGGLSDKYGRRPVLLFSLLGFGLDYFFQAFAPTLTWLFIGRAIAGITGASFSTASAYIADVSAPEKRAQNFGLIGAAFGLGFIIGPGIGSFCAEFGQRVPFLVAGGLSLLNFLYGLFVLPESLKPEKRRPFSWKRANSFGTLMQLRKYPVVSGLVVSLTLLYVAAHAVQSNWSFFTMYQFQWTERMVGISLAIVGALTLVVQGGLIRVLNPKIGPQKSVYLGFSMYALGLALFSVATEGWMMYVFLLPYCLGGIAGPALQGIISSQVPGDAQGELQGGLTSLMSATSVVGPLLMNNLFSYFSRPGAPIHFPGMPFAVGAALIVVAVIFAVYTLKNRYIHVPDTPTIPTH